MARLAGWLPLALLLSLACERDGEIEAHRQSDPLVDPRPDPLFDPQLVSFDHPVAYTFFDGRSRSIELGEGWAEPEEGTHQTEEPVTFAWAVGLEAEIRVDGVPASPVDFLGRCLPYLSEGSPQQTLTLKIGEETIATRTLEKGWQVVRIPLPDDVLQPGPGELRLAFGRAREIDQPDDPETRRLAVACQYLALVPRGVRSVEEYLKGVALDPRRRRLSLVVGTSATFPLPAGSEVTMRLGRVRSACPRCLIEVDLLTPDGEKVIWRAEPAKANHLSVSFPTPRHHLSRLRLSLRSSTGNVLDGRRGIEIELPTGSTGRGTAGSFLETRRRLAEPADARPHVFIYLIDTLRADALTPYGARRETSPQIAAFATDAVIYRDVWSASSWTLPSVVSILTGVYPYRHRVMQGKHKFSPDNVPALATLLAESGYEAIGISQSFVAGSKFGIDTGFHRFVLENQLNRSELRSQEVRRRLLASLLDRDWPRRPIFAYLHTVDPHDPYRPVGGDRRFAEETPGQLPDAKYLGHVFMSENLGDDPREVEHLRALYDGEVLYADRQFGRFVQMLQLLDLYDRSLIILLSDHGEEFGEHGGFGHGRTVYEEMLRVPLIVKYPRSEWAGTEITQRVSTIDLVPTILRSAGVDPGDLALDGTSLRPPDLESTSPARRLVFAEVNPARSKLLEPVDYRAIAVGDLKCVESLDGSDQFGGEVPRWQVFDLGRDPFERDPVAAEAPQSDRCRDLMQRWLGSRQAPAEAHLTATGEEALSELRALGYID